MYRVLVTNVSVTDLLAKAANLGDADSARSLMNLVMQFRKVCNHPELFECADVVAPFSFSRFGRTRPSQLFPESDRVQDPGPILGRRRTSWRTSRMRRTRGRQWPLGEAHEHLVHGLDTSFSTRRCGYPPVIIGNETEYIHRAFFILVPAIPGYNAF